MSLIRNLRVSGSIEVTGSFITSGSSSFSGTFAGDGSSLTGVTGSWDGNFSGSAVMTGSLDMTGSISATSFSGDGSSLTGVTAEFDGSHTGSASFSGSLEIQGRVTQIGLGESTYFGDQAGEDDDITTNKNTAFGFRALKENSAGCRNVGIGHEAFKTNTGGDNNTAVGFGAMSLNNNGNFNVAIGSNVLGNDNSGDENTIIGALAAIANDTGDRNTALGFCSLFGTHTGNCNTAIGHCAGRFATGSSTGNVFLGHMAGPSIASGDVNNKLYINNTTGSALIEGDFSLNQVTINGSLTASQGISIPTGKDLVFPGHSKITMDGDFIIEKTIGNNSMIREGGSGDLILISNNEVEIKSGEAGETFAKFTKDAGIELYTDNVKKFETTNTGVTVTGNITASGTISASGAITAPSFTGDGSGLTNVSAATGSAIYKIGAGANSILPLSASFSNISNASFSAVLAGSQNTASGVCSVVAGGFNNEATGSRSTIGGGSSNHAFGILSTVGGGGGNIACLTATVAGGDSNEALGQSSFVGGGVSNDNNGGFSSILGGGNNCINHATSRYSAILGGRCNTIATGHTGSFIAGQHITSNASDTTFVNNLFVTGSTTVNAVMQISRRTTTPSPAVEGMVIASGSAGASKLYYYDGTAFRALN